jgi:hypothetical protein
METREFTTMFRTVYLKAELREIIFENMDWIVFGGIGAG